MDDPHEESIALLARDTNLSSEEKVRYPPRFPSTFGYLRWVVLVSFALLAVDVVISLYIFRHLTSGLHPIAPELRSQYLGLEELYKSGRVNTSYYAPIINVPRLATQVSRVEPSKVFPEDQHRWLSSLGTLSPPDRHLQVSANIHTVLQFRVIDFGMERCALALKVPPSDAVLPEPFVVNNAVYSDGLNVCALDVSETLDVRTLSWAHRPQCRKNIGRLIANSSEETRLPEFPCAWGSLHTYEISCVSDSPTECALDVWSNQNATWGIFMYQFQTL